MTHAAMARAILLVALVPFLYYAGRDQLLHLCVRRVPLIENLVHLALGVVLIVTISSSFLFDLPFLAASGALFVCLGMVDEYLFHRDIPESESDVHAKEHFALLTFFVAAVCVTLTRG